MKRKIMVVTAAYGHDQVRAAGGQTAMLPIIAEAGADGVEIRRELLTDAELHTLSTVASAIEIFGLLACYSAPEPLFLEDGSLNPRLPELLEEAQALQARMAEAQEEIARIEATGTSGGGLVAVTVSGKGEVKGVRIDPSLLKPEEAEIVEDLIVAAFTDAKAHVDAEVAERMQAVTGNLPLPPGFKLPF